ARAQVQQALEQRRMGEEVLANPVVRVPITSHDNLPHDSMDPGIVPSTMENQTPDAAHPQAQRDEKPDPDRIGLLKDLYRQMLIIRRIEEAAAKAYAQGKM